MKPWGFLITKDLPHKKGLLYSVKYMLFLHDNLAVM